MLCWAAVCQVAHQILVALFCLLVTMRLLSQGLGLSPASRTVGQPHVLPALMCPSSHNTDWVGPHMLVHYERCAAGASDRESGA